MDVSDKYYSKLGYIPTPLGMHKGKPLKDLPLDYLRFLMVDGYLYGQPLEYVRWRLKDKPDTYLVTVTGSLFDNGSYTVTAYSASDAIRCCRQEYEIVGQGVSFSVTKI